ncbi:hypothetical protein SLS53_000142 [Cytospora paraplurivora]|uniref:Nephrocystin 3-like N-terminal domain-containing protein n=1 Tax=Cytospora paraplurivora TaxID=2898453 RepID=A0AAN9UM42_9PEZI
MPLLPAKLVFRLRKCPNDVDSSTLTRLLSDALGDVAVEEINIQSLARDYGICNTTKTATLMFRKLPRLVTEQPKQTQWAISLDHLRGDTNKSPEDLVLDTHFQGFTPLNDVEPEKHEFDCIVVSGLASHPFGSWQPKGNEKNYMWVRDTLPRQLPNVKAILYGYDTTLVNNRSFQSIPEVAYTLIEHLMPTGWSSSEMKPLVFLAHSLGGIVLKQTLVTLAERGTTGEPVLQRVRGGILFGAPSQGMTQGPLLAMVEGQPNAQLVKDLAKGSPYLYGLDKQFSGIGSTRGMTFNWAYETKDSPTVEKRSDGTFARTGPRQVLVARESATRGLFGSSKDAIFSIDEDHSDMVKFQAGSSICEQIVLKRLSNICAAPQDRVGFSKTLDAASQGSRSDIPGGKVLLTEGWTMNDLLDAIGADELDGRFATVEDNSSRTFEWVFNPDKAPLFNWLQDENQSLFWINGKPGCGKSTLMRFIAKDHRTEEFLNLHHPISSSVDIKAHHFFHDRGTILQKSLEGLLRSILIQFIRTMPRLAWLLTPVLQNKMLSRDIWKISELQRCLYLLLNQNDHDVRVFLLLDALDEYDGQPDFICSFLKELVKPRDSRTTVKLLFSSRPWNIFLEQFQSAPQIKVQDYNSIDIRYYCENIVREAETAVRERLGPLIPEIVERSSGVFMWVKLIVQDLYMAAYQEQDTAQIQDLLQSLPSDLSDYYAAIIQKIDHDDRWDAYVIFQVAYMTSLAGEEYELVDLIYILAVSRCRSYHESKQKLEEIKAMLYPNPSSLKMLPFRATARVEVYGSGAGPREIERYLFKGADRAFVEQQIKRIHRCCGGLVQVLAPRNTPLQIDKFELDFKIIYQLDKYWGRDMPWHVQLGHQTVKEFMGTPDFKRLLLGDEAGSIHENGFTFAAKLFLTQTDKKNAPYACTRSELTTGRSMADFFKTIPGSAIQKLAYKHEPYTIEFNEMSPCGLMKPTGPLGLAVSYGLNLCLQDFGRADPNSLRETAEVLLKGLSKAHAHEPELHCSTVKLLVREGYVLDPDKEEFQDLMLIMGAKELINPGGEGAHLLTFYRYSYTRKMTCWNPWLGPYAKMKAVAMLEVGQDPNIPCAGIRLYPHGKVREESVQYRPIHVADAELAEALIRHGADVNLDDGSGNTALDWALAANDSPQGRKRRGLRHKLVEGVWGTSANYLGTLRKIMVLVRHGAVARTTSPEIWQQYVASCRQALVVATSSALPNDNIEPNENHGAGEQENDGEEVDSRDNESGSKEDNGENEMELESSLEELEKHLATLNISADKETASVTEVTGTKKVAQSRASRIFRWKSG